MIFNKTFKIIRNCALIGGASYAGYKLIADKLFDSVFKKNDEAYDLDTQYQVWLTSSNKKDLYIQSYDGLKLHSLLIENHKTKNYIILIHGIWSNNLWMVPYAYELDKLGYNLLLVDQRASGQSEGEYYTYGLKESFDLINWTNYLISLKKNCHIVYFGVSMGAATCMMTTKNKLPDNVKCIVEDCGYSSFKDELCAVLQRSYKIAKPNPILNIFEKLMYDCFGFLFKDIVPAKALDSNEIPLLIVHGKEDHFVPFEMSKVIYNHQHGTKKYFPVSDARHAGSYRKGKYFNRVNEFIKKNLV